MMHSVRLAALLALTLAGDAPACQRWHLPETVAAAQADEIAVAIPYGASDSYTLEFRADLAIERVLEGSLGGRKSIPITRSYFCGEERLTPGQRILAYIRETPKGYVVMLDGTRPHTAEEERETLATVARLPRWSKPVKGISFMAVPVRFAIDAEDELHVVVLYRNVGPKEWTLRYRDWPREEATWWRAEGAERKRHPHVTDEEIRDFFSRNPHPFEVKLAPGEIFSFPLGPLNRADPGMGYRERYGFHYYDMREPGRYRIALRGRGLTGEEEWFERFEVTVSASPRPARP